MRRTSSTRCSWFRSMLETKSAFCVPVLPFQALRFPDAPIPSKVANVM